MRVRLVRGGLPATPVARAAVRCFPRAIGAVCPTCPTGPTRPIGPTGHVGSVVWPRCGGRQRHERGERLRPRSFFNEFFSNDEGSNRQGLEDDEDDEDENGDDDKFEKSNFVPLEDASSGLDGATEQTFGPLAILAAGLAPQEFASLKMLMNEMGADEVKLIGYSRRSMGDKPLGHVLEAACAVEIDTNVVYDAEIHMEEYGNGENNKPVAFLSGMYQSEIIEVVTALRYCEGLPDMAFAALVPNNYGRDVEGLIGSVYADHQAVAQMRAQMSGSDSEGQ